MKPVFGLIVVALALLIETTHPFAITFRDINYTSQSTRSRRPNPQIVFETESTTTIAATTTTETPKPTVTSTNQPSRLSATILNSSLPQNSSLLLSKYTLNSTESVTIENDTVIIDGVLAKPTNPPSCQQPETNSYLSDEYIRGKLCSNIHASLARNYRFDLEDKVCSQIGKQSHCGKHMIFYSYGKSSVYGHCDCDYSSQIPLVYHPQTKRCYYMYQQGYCERENWVELAKENGTSVCTKNKCFDVGRPKKFGAASLASRDMIPEFVPLRGDGPCVRLNQPNPEFCKTKSDIVAFRWPREFYPNCGPPKPEGPTGGVSGRFLGDVATPECRPGSFLTVMGTCAHEFDFD